MATKTYPIGTKIRFLHPSIDTNKVGTIVNISASGAYPDIYLPTADKHIKENRYPTLYNGVKFTWHCKWSEIEPLVVKGQQLLFSFMLMGAMEST